MNYELDVECLVKRFTAYAQINTASDERSTQLPSSEGQWQLAEYLKNELTALGLTGQRRPVAACGILKKRTDGAGAYGRKSNR